jgi:hypothetical protein
MRQTNAIPLPLRLWSGPLPARKERSKTTARDMVEKIMPNNIEKEAQ